MVRQAGARCSHRTSSYHRSGWERGGDLALADMLERVGSCDQVGRACHEQRPRDKSVKEEKLGAWATP